ncbi:hypothetical protein ACIHFE_18975 [Streptomyces sp. NPDC052396]|uniref:hypothetical protein n=1 Tax=Streptomyces sp. NPDC052396 TaxID=3365689 RepID=UPI0037CD9B7E
MRPASSTPRRARFRTPASGPSASWAGLTVLGDGQLAMPLSEVDTSVLSEGEWRQIRFFGVSTLGEVLFNSWD